MRPVGMHVRVQILREHRDELVVSEFAFSYSFS